MEDKIINLWDLFSEAEVDIGEREKVEYTYNPKHDTFRIFYTAYFIGMVGCSSANSEDYKDLISGKSFEYPTSVISSGMHNFISVIFTVAVPHSLENYNKKVITGAQSLVVSLPPMNLEDRKVDRPVSVKPGAS